MDSARVHFTQIVEFNAANASRGSNEYHKDEHVPYIIDMIESFRKYIYKYIYVRIDSLVSGIVTTTTTEVPPDEKNESCGRQRWRR